MIIISLSLFSRTIIIMNLKRRFQDGLQPLVFLLLNGKFLKIIVKNFFFQDEVNIKYNKLHADPSQGKTVDIILKKVKHRLVDNVTSSTADALGLSRAILCNDSLVKKLAQLDATEQMYRALVGHTKRVSNAFYRLLLVYKGMSNLFYFS